MEFWKNCQPRVFRWMLNARSATTGDLEGLPTQRETRSSFNSHQGELARRATGQRIMVGCQAAKIVR